MLQFETARDAILEKAARTGTERVALPEALGRVLREDYVAAHPLPPFAQCAMDGYAVNSQHAKPAPWLLPIVGERCAGSPAGELVPGTACRVFTGAPLPAGADAVLIQEEARVQDGALELTRLPAAGTHVREAGEDLAAGELALRAGTRLGPFHLGLLASLEATTVHVARRPRVAIVCTGNELRLAGSPPHPASIVESNGVVLAALARTAGADAWLTPLVEDDTRTLQRRLRQALDGADVVLTVGGVSVGTYDVVRESMTAIGAKVAFYKVAIKPGKPLTLGRLGSQLLLGLPGNPVSAQVTAALFVVPLLRQMQGDARAVAVPRSYLLGSPLKQKPGRRGFYRARLEGARVMPLSRQGSGSVVSMAEAEALIMMDEHLEQLPENASVPVYVLNEL